MKKITNFLLASALSLTALVGSASAASFSDVSTSAWYHSYITSAVDSGFMSGTGNGNFSPETSMTYGQFAVVIVNGAFDGKTTGASGSHWADIYLNTLMEKGLLQSATGTAIVAQTSGWQDQAITREDAASIIVRVMGQCSTEVKDDFVLAQGNTAISAFSDVDSSVEVGQATDIAMMMVNNIMIGSDGKFGVGTSMKRSDACVVFSSLQSKDIFTATTPSTSTTPSTGTTTTPSTGTTTAPSTSTTSKPADVVLGSGQYDTSKYTVPADTNKDGWLTNAEVNAVIDRLKAEYPTGTPWDSDKHYNLNTSIYVPGYGNVREAKGCAAWAFFVSDEIFGNLPARRVYGDMSLDPQEQIRAGDIAYSSAINHWGSTGYANSYGTMYLSSSGNTNGTVVWGTSSRYDKGQENIIEYADILYCFTRYPAE